jgi:choline transport protein
MEKVPEPTAPETAIPEPARTVDSSDGSPKAPASDELINPSGHRQELDRNFRLINIAGLGITSGNTWIAIGGSIVRPILIQAG